MDEKARYYAIRCDTVTSVYMRGEEKENSNELEYKCYVYSKLPGSDEETMMNLKSDNETQIVNIFNQILDCLKVYNSKKSLTQDFIVIYKLNGDDYAELLSQSN